MIGKAMKLLALALVASGAQGMPKYGV